MVWEPKQCCCGASIRVGALVIGWISIIFSCLQVLSSLRFAALTHSDYKELCTEAINERGDQSGFDPETCANVVISVIAVDGVLSGISVIISSLLVVGINKYKPKLMIPFMVAQVIGLTLGCILSAILVIGSFALGIVILGFTFAIIFGLILFLHAYLFLIVRACYNEVKQHVDISGNTDIRYVEQVPMPYPYKS